MQGKTGEKAYAFLRKFMLGEKSLQKSISHVQKSYACREKLAKKHKPCSEILCLQGKIGEKAVAFQERLLPVRKRQEKSSIFQTENTAHKGNARKKQ